MKLFSIRLSLLAFLLAFVVIGLGAYTRLKDAGLGCPDWPLCYGHITAPIQVDAADNAMTGPYEAHKAWAEMIHRYFAGSLGLLILCLVAIGLFKKSSHHPKKLAIFLLLLLIFQGLLGMWTVTLKLHPLVVMAHLLFGFTTLSTLWWYHLQLKYPFPRPASYSPKLYGFSLFALIILALQISLGGWTSTNYAALACPDFPTCQGSWWPHLDLKNAFNFFPTTENTFEFGVLDNSARLTIHFFHRIGAIITALVLWTLAFLCQSFQDKVVRRLGQLLALFIGLQLLLGINNVLSHLSLHNAVAHNVMAAIILITVLSLLFFQTHARMPTTAKVR